MLYIKLLWAFSLAYSRRHFVRLHLSRAQSLPTTNFTILQHQLPNVINPVTTHRSFRTRAFVVLVVIRSIDHHSSTNNDNNSIQSGSDPPDQLRVMVDNSQHNACHQKAKKVMHDSRHQSNPNGTPVSQSSRAFLEFVDWHDQPMTLSTPQCKAVAFSIGSQKVMNDSNRTQKARDCVPPVSRVFLEWVGSGWRD